MANHWLRLWHDMPNDPKWRTISRVSKQPVTAVLAVYVHVLVCASNATERGRTDSVCSEDVASALDLDTEQVAAILEAMQGRVLEGNQVSGWAKRQVEREDGSAERSKAWREAKKAAELADLSATERNRTQTERKKTPDTDTDTDTDTDKDKNNYIGAQPLVADESATQQKAPCPAEAIVSLYHELMPNNPRVKVLNKGRRLAIRSRWAEAAALDCKPFGYANRADGLEAWRRFFEVCNDSDFLTGRTPGQNGRPPFVADIDFLMTPSGFAKCLENKYHRELLQ